MRAIAGVLFIVSLIAAINVVGPAMRGEGVATGTLIASFWLLLAAIFFAVLGQGNEKATSKKEENPGTGEKRCPYCELVYPSRFQYCPSCGKDEEGNTKEEKNG